MKTPLNARIDNRTGLTTYKTVCVDPRAISGLPRPIPGSVKLVKMSVVRHFRVK